jgi:hypothetical protein
VGVASDGKQRVEMAKSGFLSPVRLPLASSMRLAGLTVTNSNVERKSK